MKTLAALALVTAGPAAAHTQGGMHMHPHPDPVAIVAAIVAAGLAAAAYRILRGGSGS